MSIEQLKYPIGKYQKPDSLSAAERNALIERIKSVPSRVRELLPHFNNATWQNTYREGSWTAIQVLHHMGDSHINAYVRLKLGMTEDTPVIKPYDENAWVQLPDMTESPESTAALLEIIHRRLVILFSSLDEAGWSRRYFHPQSNQHFTLEQLLALYAWHGDHHLAHLKLALESK
ncbi:MAG: bacillithiol transferase BstA [Bacteroidota bacterium]